MMHDTTFRGWVRPGPRPPGGSAAETGETLDYICGHWKLFQLAKGHRYSIDDLLVAWFGTNHCPRPASIADLGSGISSVAMAMAWRCPGASVFTIEAQAESLALARKSAAYNGVVNRFTMMEGDLRDPSLFQDHTPFDLVTGTPPYWPLGTRSEAAHPQAVPARLEARGTIADYAITASSILAPGGYFATVFPNDQEDRAASAFRDAGLLLLNRQEVVFKEGEPYGLVLLGGSRAMDMPPNLRDHPDLPYSPAPIIVRRRDGRFHPSILSFRLTMGFPPGVT
jgi:tRNA1Val (adenine37-N6)-methyltransferase